MSDKSKFLGIGAIVIFVVLAIYFIEEKPKQEFEQEVDLYLTIANLRPELIDVVFKDDALDDYRGNYPEIFKESRMDLRELFQQTLDDPLFKIQIQIDRKNRVIVINYLIIDQLGIIGWYAA